MLSDHWKNFSWWKNAVWLQTYKIKFLLTKKFIDNYHSTSLHMLSMWTTKNFCNQYYILFTLINASKLNKTYPPSKFLYTYCITYPIQYAVYLLPLIYIYCCWCKNYQVLFRIESYQQKLNICRNWCQSWWHWLLLFISQQMININSCIPYAFPRSMKTLPLADHVWKF